MLRVLGIDCGGSTTRAVLVEEGKPVWTGLGGPSNLSSSPNELTRKSITAAIEGCPDAAAVCGAFAGLITDNQKKAAEELLQPFFPQAPITAVTDFEAALVACGDDIDVCVLAGTGSLICSFGTNGALHRSGGRGYLLGDEGSAFQYGRDALLHFLDGPPDDISAQLVEGVTSAFGSAKKSEVIMAVYAAEDKAKRIAGLAEPFAEDALRGTLYALKSLRIHTSKLAHVVSQHLRQYHSKLKSARIGCQGGLWSSDVFRDIFAERLGFWCKVDDILVDFDLPAPVYGAAEIARRLL
ncbi:MAG: hypothetical protein H0W86_12615 [Armatimonadetes bacterium]|nr:hypothetical protein [Armatimonadota bacterium]